MGLAKDVESQGAMGVILNAPITNLNLIAVSAAVDIPVIITVTHIDTDISARLEAGASILNIACAGRTPEVVAHIRKHFPDVPIITVAETPRKTLPERCRPGQMPLPLLLRPQRSCLKP